MCMSEINYRKNLHNYILSYPGNMVGFLTDVCLICEELSQAWLENNKLKWSNVFLESSKQIMSIAKRLDEINSEFNK